MISVLFFAELRESAGSEKITLEADGITVNELKRDYLSKYKLDNLDHAMVAINEEYVQGDAVLSEGDVVAFIPPVSGG